MVIASHGDPQPGLAQHPRPLAPTPVGGRAECCKITPALIGTFVETPRYTCAFFRASGCIRIGATRECGRYDRDKRYHKPRKDVWLRPVRRDWRRALNR